MSVSAPASREIVQRDADNQGSIPVAGSFDQPFDTIKARASVRPGYAGSTTAYTTIFTQSPAATGNFSGNVTASGGYYNLDFQAFRGGQQIGQGQVQRIAFGDIFINAGQSNATNSIDQQFTPNDAVLARPLVGAWRHGYDPQPTSQNSNGSVWPKTGDAILTENGGVPVGFLTVAVDGTSVADWLPGGSNYDNRLKVAVQSFPANGFKAVLWMQGEADKNLGTATATYKSRLQTIIDQTRTDAGWTVPWGISKETYESSSADAALGAAQWEVADDYAACFRGPNVDSLGAEYRQDVVHLNAAGATALGPLWGSALATEFGW